MINPSRLPEGGFFPSEIAEAGVLLRVQDAQASRDGDEITILNHIVQSNDPRGDPLQEEMNRAVQELSVDGGQLFS